MKTPRATGRRAKKLTGTGMKKNLTRRRSKNTTTTMKTKSAAVGTTTTRIRKPTDINLRFPQPADYNQVKRAAKVQELSANAFITQAAMELATKVLAEAKTVPMSA